ncbi:MAG TPA: PEP-CTERM sorting domain-containing protein [Edaphobacter sp.]|jgi:hypothetical protein|nr:PEP-CTERM sorting domain-containing protein [Edaphobacter sp.]
MRLSLLALASILAAGSSPLLADDIPYANVGQLAPANTLTASANGTVVGYFVGSSAGDNDTIALWDVSRGTFSGFVLPNHSSTVGAPPTTFLSVGAGDTLVFILDNVSTGQYEDSVNDNGIPTTWSADGYNNAYTTAYTGGIAGLPSGLTGTYVGMEDLAVTGLNPLTGSDLDYNDDTFVFTDIATTSPTPEPASFVLFGTGLLGAAGILRRKFAR